MRKVTVEISDEAAAAFESWAGLGCLAGPLLSQRCAHILEEAARDRLHHVAARTADSELRRIGVITGDDDIDL